MISPEEQEEEKTVHLSVRGFKDSLHKRLKIEAVKRSLPLGDLLNSIVEEWLTNHENESNQ